MHVQYPDKCVPLVELQRLSARLNIRLFEYCVNITGKKEFDVKFKTLRHPFGIKGGKGCSSGGGMSGIGEGVQGLKKGPRTATEDVILIEYVSMNGEGNWNAVQRNTLLQRCWKSCRIRWDNPLRPNVKKGAFTAEEVQLILELHAKYGYKWTHMASQMPGRTDNEIKNYWKRE